MKLLVANPNTTQPITDLIAEAARRVASPGTTIKAVTGGFGAAVIGSRMEMVIGDYAALDLVARELEGCDAVVIGASIDSGLRAVRQMAPVPVIGMTEAVLHTACLTAGRFGLVVSSARVAGVMQEMVAGYGLSSRLAGIRWLGTEAQNIMADPETASTAIVEASDTLVSVDLAEVVVLIGAVMANIPARVQERIAVPVLEGITCAVPMAEALVRMKIPKPRGGSFAQPAGRR